MEQCATFDDLINAKEETTILELAAWVNDFENSAAQYHFLIKQNEALKNSLYKRIIT